MPNFQEFKVTADPNPMTIAVIGHRGRMGQMFCHLWSKAGHTLQCADLRDPVVSGKGRELELADPHISTLAVKIDAGDLAVAVRGARIIVLCVPVLALHGVLESLEPILEKEQILVDITSVKTIPMQQMEAVFQGGVVGTHPLFGPVAEFSELVTAITPGQNSTEDDVQEVERLFTCFECKCMRTTPADHDLGVGFAQALNFATNAMYFATVAERPEILPFITPSFRRRMQAGEKQLTDDANMFLGFVAANPQMPIAMAQFRKTMDEVEENGLEEVARKAQTWYRS